MRAVTLTSARQDVFKLQACSFLLTLIISSFQACLLFLFFFCSSLIFFVLLSGGAFQSVFSAAVLDSVALAQTSGSCWSRCVCLAQQPPCHVVYIPRL